MPGPSKEVIRHLDESEVTAAIDDAQKAEQARLVRRLCFVRNLYEGDSVTEAAERVGTTQPTGSRWVEAWNEDGVDGLVPDFGGGRPPKLSDSEREQLVELVQQYYLTVQQVQQLLADGFDVSYSRRHVKRLLEQLDLQNSVASAGGTENTDTTASAGANPLQNALAELDDGDAGDDDSHFDFLEHPE